MQQLCTELVFAGRTLAKSAGFTFITVLSLALAFGINIALFTLVDQTLLKPLPIREPQRIVQLTWRGYYYGSTWGAHSFSYPMYLDLRNHGTAFTGVFCRFATELNMTYGAQAERVTAELVSGNYYEVLGIRPAIGRLIHEEDARLRGAAAYAVLGYDFWISRFAGAPSILGQTIRLNKHPFTVIGVAQRGFRGLDSGYNSQVIVPVTMKKSMTPLWDALDDRRTRWVQVFGRLKTGETIESAAASLQPGFKAIVQAETETEDFRRVSSEARKRFLDSHMELMPASLGHPEFRKRFQMPLILLFCIAGIVLLIAVSNVANLLLGRTISREKEIGICLALGIGRRRLLFRLLSEPLMLATAGTVAGLLLAFLLNRYLLRLVFPDPARVAITGSPDIRVIAFAIVLTFLAGVLLSLTPALHALRVAPAETLKQNAGSVSGTGALLIRKGLVIGQIALSLLLLVAAGLFLRTLARLQSLNPGFRTSELISVSIDPALSGYNKQQMLAFFRQTQQALTTVSGVSSVGLSRVRLIDGMRWTSRRIAVQGYQARPNEDMEPWVNAVSPDFFATLGIPLIAGRDFRESDERPCAIVNERFAQYYFGDSPAIGKRFGFGADSDNSLDIEIIGVVRDSRYRSLREDIPRQIYMLYLQTGTPTAMHVYIRTILPPEDLLRAVRGAISTIDSSLPVYDVRTIEQQIERSLILERAIAVLAATLAGVAMLLAIIGLYGVMAYTVARRTREIGLRIALGACAPHVVMIILKDVLILTSCGVVVGLTATLPFRHHINSQLYDLAPEDPVTLIGATVILYFVAVISAYLPARQAARLDPLRALRYD